MFKVRNVGECPILFSGAEMPPKIITGVESLSRSESSNLDICDIFGLVTCVADLGSRGIVRD